MIGVDCLVVAEDDEDTINYPLILFLSYEPGDNLLQAAVVDATDVADKHWFLKCATYAGLENFFIFNCFINFNLYYYYYYYYHYQ